VPHIIARKKLIGQRVTLDNQIRGLAVVFGVRLPRALRSSTDCDFNRAAPHPADPDQVPNEHVENAVRGKRPEAAQLLASSATMMRKC
jgi:hypothetical protein